MRVTFWNKGAEDMFGWTAAEVMGREAGPLLEARIEGSDREGALRRLREAGHYESRVHFKHKDGRFFTADVRSAVLKGPAGKITGAMAAIRDCGKSPAGEGS
jgi:PAS domain S-box-containing protein